MFTQDDLAQYANKALCEIGETQVAEQLSISWNPRMRSAAGRAKLQAWTIEINPKLIPFGEQEVYTTVLHELAHLVAWRRHQHRGHGLAWRQACADLGIPDESVTHQLPLPRRQQRKNYRYKCETCDLEFDRVKPAKKTSACAVCCKEFNKGKFHSKYLLTEYRLVYD